MSKLQDRVEDWTFTEDDGRTPAKAQTAAVASISPVRI